jgi:hypothetical protein
MCEPTAAELRIVRSRLSTEAWQERVQVAKQDAELLAAVAAHVESGDSLNESIAAVLPPSRRSWAIRHWHRYLDAGWEGLVDRRLPREPRQAQRVREEIEALCADNLKLSLPEAVAALEDAKPKRPLPSPATLKRELSRARAQARRDENADRVETTQLQFAGGELMLAAEVETGAIAALRDEVVAIGKEAVEASAGRVPAKDLEHRDRRGRFTVTYNRKRRRKRGEAVASYLRSAEEKADGRVPRWPRFVRERPPTIEAKLRTLVFEPLVSRVKGWAGLRSPDAAALEPLTGFAYMPSTLAKLTSALAISSAGPRLLEAAGRVWHGVARDRWGEDGAMAALYVDNHAKEVWTSLFTQSGKVSSLNRVMPAITTTYVHTGAGTPLVMGVQSGGAPLAPRLAELVERAERQLGDGIRRAVVIDSEGSTFDILASFAGAKRVIVTPLRPSRMPELELRHGQGSYFRAYRENDELRIGSATLHHRTTGRSVEVGVLEVRRNHREADTVLLTTGLELGFEGRELADLYFARWPLQESWFRDGEVVKLDEHRGNCSRVVTNVAVVTESERLERQLDNGWLKVCELEKAAKALGKELEKTTRDEARKARRLATRRRRLDRESANGDPTRTAFARAAAEHHGALVEWEATQRTLEHVTTRARENQHQREKLEARLHKAEARLKTLADRKKIRQVDVALDTVLTSAKLTGAQLISFVLREYLASHPMSPQTFAARVFPVRGRKETRRDSETITFYANPRDSDVTEAVVTACRRLNARRLTREGRRLHYKVEDPPTVESQSG